MNSSALKKSTPAPSGFQFRLSDMLVLSLLCPPALFVIFLSNRGWILFEHGNSPRAYEYLRMSDVIFWWMVFIVSAMIFTALVFPRFCKPESGTLRRSIALSLCVCIPFACTYFIMYIFVMGVRDGGPYDRHSRSACDLIRVYQEQFRDADPDKNGVEDYCAVLEDLEPFVSNGRKDAKTGAQRYRGYLFKLLFTQGPGAPGGRKSYRDANGNLTQGYAILAWPYLHGVSGIDSYLYFHDGTKYEKDFGPDTEAFMEKITEADPTGWTKIEP